MTSSENAFAQSDTIKLWMNSYPAEAAFINSLPLNEFTQLQSNLSVQPLSGQSSSTGIVQKDQNNQYTSPGEKFERQTKLYAGKNFTVFSAVKIETGVNVCWTVFLLSDFNPDDKQNLQTQIDQIQQFNHAALYNFHEAWITKDGLESQTGKVKLTGLSSTAKTIQSGSLTVIPSFSSKPATQPTVQDDIRNFGFLLLEILMNDSIKEKDRQNEEFVAQSIKRIKDGDLKELINTCCTDPQSTSALQILSNSFLASNKPNISFEELIMSKDEVVDDPLVMINEDSDDSEASSSGSEYGASINPLQWANKIQQYKAKGETQSGPLTNQLEAFLQSLKKEKRKLIIPKSDDYTSLIGFLALKFETVDSVGNKGTRAMSGTGSLYHRITQKIFVIVTCAHNFIQFEETMGNANAKLCEEAWFYLQRSKYKYKFKFSVLKFDVSQKYYKTKTFLYGDDIALAVVEVDDTDKNFSLEELSKIQIPIPAPFDDRDKKKVGDKLCRVVGYPIDIFDPKSGSSGHMEKNPSHLYEDEGPIQDIQYYAMDDSAVLSYEFTKIVTSGGQSGSPLQMITPDSPCPYQTIGVHVGNLDTKNYSTMFIENIFIDFMMPTLFKFQKEFSSDDPDNLLETTNQQLLLQIEKQYEKVIDQRQVQRGKNEIQRNKQLEIVKKLQLVEASVKKLSKEMNLDENVNTNKKSLVKAIENKEQDKVNFKQLELDFLNAKEKYKKKKGNKQDSDFDRSEEEDSDDMVLTKNACRQAKQNYECQRTPQQIIDNLKHVGQNMERLKRDMQEDEVLELKDPRQSSTFSPQDQTISFQDVIKSAFIHCASKAIDNNYETYSQTRPGSGEFWTAQFAQAPKKINMVRIMIPDSDESCGVEHLKFYVSEQEFVGSIRKKQHETGVIFEIKAQNPICGDFIKIQSTKEESLSIKKIQVVTINYKDNTTLNKTRAIFDELTFGKYEEDLKYLNPECIKQLQDYKLQYYKVGLINIKMLLGIGFLALQRDEIPDETEDKQPPLPGAQPQPSVQPKPPSQVNPELIPYTESVYSGESGDNSISIKSGQLSDLKDKVIGLGRNILLKTAKDHEGNILSFTNDSFIEEGLFHAHGKLNFGRRIEGSKQKVGWFNYGRYLHGIGRIYSQEGDLEQEGLFVKDKLKEKTIVSKLLYYDDDRYTKRYCDLRDDKWQEQNWNLIMIKVHDSQLYEVTKQKEETLEKVKQLIDKEQAIQQTRDRSFQKRKEDYANAFKLLSQDQQSNNVHLSRLMKMFWTKPDLVSFNQKSYHNFLKQEITQQCIEQLSLFQFKLCYDHNFLNIEKLLIDGLVMVKRRFNSNIVAFHTPHLGTYYNNPCIRAGQLNTSHKVNGLGRKIVLHPVYSLTTALTTIIDFETWTYFEEGQFINDELNGTFGRRIRMDGTTRIGWFEEYGFCLHGYGKEVVQQGDQKSFEKAQRIN